MQTPCTCFLTFESEEGYSRAQIYNKLIRDGKLDKYCGQLLSGKVLLNNANEPTDIIWENR